MKRSLLIAFAFTLSSIVTTKANACSILDGAGNEVELVNKSSLVIVSTPISQVKEVPVVDQGYGEPSPDTSNYYQNVRVQEVLKGEAPNGSVTVMTWGISEEGKKKGRLSTCSNVIPDKIHQGKQILFLTPLPEQANVFRITGYSRAGDLELDSSDKVKPTKKGFAPFSGLALPEVRERVKQITEGLLR